MTNTFRTQFLAGNRALVTGTSDAGNHQVVLDSTEFTNLKRHLTTKSAAQAFDDDVAAFFAPVTEAAEKLEAAQKIASDPAFRVVLEEGVSHVRARQELAVELDKDTVVLRLIEQGDTSRLLWVGDNIEVLAYDDTAPAVTPEDFTPEDV